MIKHLIVTAWRNLGRNKMFTALNIAGPAIGVAVCLLIGVWLQRELSFDNFHPQSENIFRITNTFKSESETFSQAPSGIALGAQLPRQLPAVKAACRVFRFEYKFKEGNRQFFEPYTVIADSGFFNFFGFKLKEGQPGQVLNGPNQVVVTEQTAIKYFGKSSDVIGKTILMDDQPMIVSGVAENAPINSHLQFDIIVPYSYFRNWAIKTWKNDPDDQWVGGWPYTYVQLADAKKWRETEKDINAVIAKFSAKEWEQNKMSYQYFLQPIRDIHLKSRLRYDAANNGSASSVNIFAVVGIIVLLLACINYVNLTTAGAIKRAKETAVRKVVGATRPQLVRQFFSETLVICAIAVILGVIICKSFLPFFSTWIGRPYSFPLTSTNILIILAFIFLMAAAAGIYPAAILSSFNPAAAAKGRFLQSNRGNMIRKGLVVFQFTTTIALVASILIISRQMHFIKNKSLGFNGNAVVEVIFNGDDKVNQEYPTIRNELLKSPHILNVSKHNANIVDGLGNGWTTTINGQGEEVSTSIYRLSVDEDYLDTYSMKLAAGRFFSKDFPTDTSKSVLINEAAVATFGWGSPQNALGKPFGKGNDTRYVVGVLKDFHFESLHKPVDALLIGYVKSGNILSLKIDAAHMPEALNQLTTTWKTTLPELPLEYFFVDDRIAEQYGNEMKMEGIFYGFSALSLLIACLGLFGLSTFVVERKTREIGIRKVLGASVPGIVTMLSRDFLKLVIISALIATPIAWYFMYRWLQDFAYRITISWTYFLLAGIISLMIALVTVSIQSIKAAMANPTKSLRTE